MTLIMPRRRFLAGLASLIGAPAIVRPQALMPICVWRPSFHRARIDAPTPPYRYLLVADKNDLLGVDLASLGLPPPQFPLDDSKYEYYWRYDQFPLEGLPRDKIRIPRWQQAELELSGSASCAAF
jgi:hypothetical protein